MATRLVHKFVTALGQDLRATWPPACLERTMPRLAIGFVAAGLVPLVAAQRGMGHRPRSSWRRRYWRSFHSFPPRGAIETLFSTIRACNKNKRNAMLTNPVSWWWINRYLRQIQGSLLIRTEQHFIFFTLSHLRACAEPPATMCWNLACVFLAFGQRGRCSCDNAALFFIFHGPGLTLRNKTHHKSIFSNSIALPWTFSSWNMFSLKQSSSLAWRPNKWKGTTTPRRVQKILCWGNGITCRHGCWINLDARLSRHRSSLTHAHHNI